MSYLYFADNDDMPNCYHNFQDDACVLDAICSHNNLLKLMLYLALLYRTEATRVRLFSSSKSCTVLYCTSKDPLYLLPNASMDRAGHLLLFHTFSFDICIYYP